MGIEAIRACPGSLGYRQRFEILERFIVVVRKTAVIAAIAAVGITGLAACSSSSTQTSSTPTVSASVPPVAGTATEVSFAQSMIPHHEQAVEMADMALNPKYEASPEVQQLAEQIKSAQGPEIEQMTQWLQQWGAPTTSPGGHMHGMDHDMGGMTMSGMMSPKQMKELRASRGTQFDQLWLSMMIEHHQGAIDMAQQVEASSTNPQVQELANQIIAAQQEEIATMQELLAAGGQ